MFNEVYKTCPECGGHAEAQIPQVTRGFGEFNLDRLETLFDLSDEEKDDLVAYLKDATFYCGSGHSFKVDARRQTKPGVIYL